MNTSSFESEIGRYHLEMGILICHSKNTKRTRENIAANAALVKELTGNKPIPLLIFLSPSPMPDKATRRYAASILPELFRHGDGVETRIICLYYESIVFITQTSHPDERLYQ